MDEILFFRFFLASTTQHRMTELESQLQGIRVWQKTALA
jgi:hypothetical protein